MTGYGYDAENNLTSITDALGRATGFAYDAYGRVTVSRLLSVLHQLGTTTYTWDVENRLLSVALPGSDGTVTFKYDPFGRRIQKASPSGTINFAYDDDNTAEELNGAGIVTAQYAQGARN